MSLPAGKWGVAYTIEVPVPKRAVVDFSVSADWTPATGDSKISKDGGNLANTTNLPAILGGTGAAAWQQTLTATEMQATSRVFVQWVDSATKAVEDQAFIIEIEYGIRSNTAQAGASTTITLDASASAVDDFYAGEFLEIISGTGAGQIRRIASYVGSTKVATVGSAWATNPDNTSIFRIGFIAAGNVNTTHVGGTAQTGADVGGIVSSGTHGNAALKTLIDAVDNFVDTEIAAIQTTLGTPAGASLAADLVVIDDFVDALESRLTAARAGYLDNINNSNLASVPAFPSNFASLGINASGHVSRVTLVDTTTTNTDMITAAGIRAAVGLSSANLDTQLTAIDDYLDTELAAVLAAVDTEVASIATAVGTTIPAQISALLTTAGTESYRADGATGSVFQLLYEIMALTGEFGITGTTKQHKKIDGSSNAFASTLDSATTPTSITRSLSA